ncbi:MAG: type II toxin-antitoxin system Phd/YefM family antitoxin [Eggerthellaceae bacterium]|nr:type II toxin-antitoxin system Phd/YefM family antitoxin [Eggerthellaceae bacterium]
MASRTASVAEARNNFSKLAESVNETGIPVVVFRHSKPWVKIMPVFEDDYDDEYIEAMDAIIADGLKAYEEGRYVVGTNAARKAVEKRLSTHA